MTAITSSILPIALPNTPATRTSPFAIDADGDADGSISSAAGKLTKGTAHNTSETPGSKDSTADSATQTLSLRGAAVTLDLSTAAQALLSGDQ